MSSCDRLPNHLPPVVAISPFEWACIVGLHILGTMYQWCVAAFNTGIWNIPTHKSGCGLLRTDAHQDQHIVRVAVAASREEIHTHVAPAISPRSIGNHLLAAGLRSRVPLGRLSLHDGCKHVQRRPGERHLLVCIHPRYLRLHGVWAISYKLRSHLVFPQGILRGVQLPWPARTPDLSPIEHVWDIMKWNLVFLKSLPQPLPNCNNRYKLLGTIYHRVTFNTFMTICIRQYMPALLTEGTTLCIDVTVWTPLTVTCFFPLF